MGAILVEDNPLYGRTADALDQDAIVCLAAPVQIQAAVVYDGSVPEELRSYTGEDDRHGQQADSE
jgi:hypothetical protein